MEEFKKDIIVPVNFSSDTENSIEEAVFLSRLLKSKIHLINIIKITDWWSNMVISKDIKEKLQLLSLENLKNIANKYDDIEFEFQVLYGKIHEQILKYSESVSAGLIVLCDKHKEEDKNKVLGSIVTHVITESKIPVITIKSKIDTELKNIVIPVDLSDNTEAQINSALAFNANCNAKLHFVSVLFDSYRNQNRRIKTKAKKLEKKLKEYNVEYSVNLIRKRKAYAYRDILEYAEKVNSDLIFIMTHKEKINFDNYIGAFAHQIINYSKVPVLTITSQATCPETNTFINQFIDPLGVFKSNEEN